MPLASELLETRTLLTSPQFVSVSPNLGEFLTDGTERNEAPRELTFQFSPGQTLQASTLGAIQIYAAAHDGDFTPASTVTDFGTGGAVILQIGTARLGAAEDGTTLDIQSMDLAGTGPTISGTPGSVTLTLDSNASLPTRAQDLIDFIETDPVASALLTVDVIDGDLSTDISAATGTLTLSGSGSASALRDFGVSGLRMRFVARNAGTDGNRISLQFQRRDLGSASAAPSLRVTGNRIEVTLNDNATSPTTAADLASAIQGNAAASALIEASVPVGTGTESLAGVPDGTLVQLSGADTLLNPGYRDLHPDRSNEVIYRFEQSLNDDVYRIQVVGAGANPLTNVTSEAVNNGADTTLDFTLNLGAEVESVDPQPVLRDQVLTILDPARITDGDLLILDPGTLSASFATVQSDLDSSSAVTVSFTAVQAGSTGNGIPVRITRQDLGTMNPARLPQVTVTDGVIDVVVNLNATAATTAQELVDAVNGNADASALVTAELTGTASTAIGTTLTGPVTVTTAGAIDLLAFEFNNTDVDASSRSGNFTIDFTNSTTAADLAIAVQNAVNGSTAQTISRGIAATASGSSVTIRGAAFDPRVTLSLADTGGARVRAGGLTQRLNLVNVYFGQDELAADRATDPRYYRLFDTQGTLDLDDDVVRIPTSVVYDNINHTATLDFGSDLPDATYRLRVGDSNESNDLLSNAENVGTLFSSLDFTRVGVLGDQNDSEDVDLYRFEVAAGATITVNVTPEAGVNTALRLFDDSGSGMAIDMDDTGGAGATDTISFNAMTGGTFYVGVSTSTNNNYDPTDGSGTMSGGATGSYLISIGSDVTIATTGAGDDNSSFGTATGLGTLGANGFQVTAAITPQSVPLPPPAGGPDEPGHREIPAESHGVGPGTNLSTPGALGTVTFYFPSVYGVDAQGGALINQITPAQRQRAREIFEMYGSLYGFEVRESSTSGIGIVTGDPRVLLPPGASPNSVGGIAGSGLAIMNDLLNFTAQDDQFGGSWMGIAIHEIGHAIGLGHSYDIRSYQGNGTQGEDAFPGHNDIVHGRRISPNTGTDIDLYQFVVETEGQFTAEIVAERMSTSSLLNSALKLYRQESDGSRTLIAQNDDYFSNDAYINLMLQPGTYFVGVSSTGNTDYDPSVSDTGFNGTSEGVYQLLLNFTDETTQSLRDATGQRFDGDSDGVAGGGGFEFHFQSDTTPLLVDKSVATNLVNNITASSTSFSVRDASVFGATSGFRIRVGNEVMLVTNVVGNVLTVVRAQNSTIATTHAAGRAVRPADASGNPTQPFGIISDAIAAATSGDIIRVVGNGGADNDILTVNDNRPYLLGTDDSFNVLEDGQTLEVPQNVVLQFDAGAIVKAQEAVIDAGTSAVGIDRSGSAIQVLGTPQREVYFTTYENDLIGGDSDGATDGANPGDWGGLVFRADSDFQAPDAATFPNNPGIFLNYVNHASISFGGGQVIVDSVESTFAPIHMVSSRPTVSFNTITNGAAAAVSANPDAFDDSRGRIGPDLHDNVVIDNTFNGLFVRIETDLGRPIDRLTTSARFDDTDIVHIITENLEIVGNPGGPLDGAPRLSGRLAIDPGVVVKMGASRIEGLRGNSHLIAEGTPENPVVITSTNDDRYGAGGTFDTTGNMQSVQPAARDWGGLAFNANSRLSVSHAFIAFGGGETPIEGGADDFNVIEIHHGVNARIADSTFESNGPGGGGNRNGRGSTSQSTIFVRQAQPIIVNNVFRNNLGNVIDINANAMVHTFQRDTGRSTGELNAYDQFADNHGPLVRLNRMDGNTTNGMNVRGDVLTTESIWDDTDIVHVLRNEITVDQHHTYSGLRLQSSVGESLVVKLEGPSAGFTADGILLDIDDRIGGTVQIIGRPGFPVVLTSLHDDSVGASLDPSGFPQTDTNNNGSATSPSPGDWRSLQFHQHSNDRNVRVELEVESARNGGIELNNNPGNARFLGELAPQHYTGPPPADQGAIDTVSRADGDDNRPVGFEIHGFISADDPGDVDVYSFDATAGDQIWIDLDRTRGAALDPVVELVQANGVVVAAARYNHTMQRVDRTGTANSLTEHSYLGGDFYTFNPYDTGFRVVLPGTPGVVGTYFVRVRSNQASQAALDADLAGGLTSGEYQLQIRTQQVDEKPGSVVRFADIRYPTTGIEVSGLPAHSPLLTESIETTRANGPNQTHQPLGNLLESDRNTIAAGGTLSSGTDIDFFQFNIDYATTILGPSIQSIGGINDGGKTWTTVFDVDYADGLTRGDTTLIVYDASGVPILIGRESNIEDDRPSSPAGDSLDDLTRGSVGFLDPYIGPVQMVGGTPGATTNYSYAVSSNSQLNRQLDQTYQASATNPLVRLEPVNSVTRVVEDHIGFQGYRSTGAQVDPEHTDGLFDITDETTLTANVRSFDLGDVPLFVTTSDQLYVYDPLYGQLIQRVDDDLVGGANFVGDIVMRSDGVLYGYEALNNTNNSVGRLVTIDPGTGATTVVGNDNITGENAFRLGASTLNDMVDLTTSDTTTAVTFRRNGPSNGGQGYWEGYYVVVDNEGPADLSNPGTANSDGFRNSKLYRFNADTGEIQNRPGVTDQGFADIQYAGVTYATTTLFVADGTAPSSIIEIEANAPGTAGNGIVINVNYVTNSSGATVTAASLAGRSITIRIDDGASAQAVVDAINQHNIASQLVQAAIQNNVNDTASSGAGPSSTSTTGGVDDPTNGVIRGNVTGLAFDQFSGGQLYGITNQGELLSINRDNGIATLVYDFNDDPANFGVSSVDFRGLALAPQSLHDGLFSTGDFSNTLFTINDVGELVAFRINAAAPAGIEPVYAFGSDNEVQQLDVTGTPTGGTFTLTFDSDTYGPLTTTALPFNATAAQIQAALEALRPQDRLGDTIDSAVNLRNTVEIFATGDLMVTGTSADAGDIQIEFTGFYEDKAVSALQINSALVGGTLSISNPEVDSFATASTDYGTAGAVTVDYTAVAMGSAGDGITIDVISDDLGAAGTPSVNVAGQTITVTLNNNPGNESTYQELVDAITGSGAASALVTPNLTGNGALTVPATTVQASATSNYNTFGFNRVDVLYEARATGVAGAGIDIVVTTADLGMGTAPTVVVNGAMDQITVTLNSNAASQSTAQDLRNAIVANATANSLISVTLTGNAATNLGGTITGSPTVTTAGNFQLAVGSSVTTGNFNERIGGDGKREAWISNTGRTGATGLAFSPLDFNLWHPTTRRGAADEPGHGINPLYDLTRTPSDEDVSFSDPQGDQYNLNQQQGGTSFYFGLEQFSDAAFTQYLNYQDSNSQYGVMDNEYQRDLTTTTTIGNNYNLAGGAVGSLLTAPFDLISDTGTESNRDRPTLYFNYFLETENDATADPDGEFTDSARVFLSNDGGRTWNLLATNNTPRGDNTELPHFGSHSRLANNTDSRQRIQELFDNTGTWRQARVDLSDFVGQSGLRLRFDFSTAGTIVDASLTTNDGDLATPVDSYGSLTGDTDDYRRSQNNNFEGFYIDDIIVGWTERGEMISAATADQNYFTVPQPDPSLMLPQEILTGDYQVEVRRGFEFAANASPTDPEVVISNTFDSNIRHISGTTSVTSDTTGLPLPQTVTDLFNVPVTDDFELNDSDPATFGFDPSVGWVPNGTGSNATWSVQPTAANGATTTLTSTLDGTTLTGLLTVNDASIFPAGQFLFFVDDEPIGGQVVFGNTVAYTRQAATAVAHSSGALVANGTFAARSGTIGANQSSVMQVTVTTNQLTFDYKLLADSGDRFQVFVDSLGGTAGAAFDTSASTGGAFVNHVIDVEPGTHTFYFVYTKDGSDTSGIPDASEGVFLDNVVFQGLGGVFIRGDRNLQRRQGHFQIESNIIRDVAGVGIDVSAGPRPANSNLPTPGSPINFDQNNAERLAPGVTIANNVITGFGNIGIRFGGDADSPGNAADPASAVPFGKIINNTIFGANNLDYSVAGPRGVGVRIENHASPTLLNNIIANTSTAIVNAVSGSVAPVINRTFFHGNSATGTTGQNFINDPSGAGPLFVNVGTRNFYLADGADAIDRSLGSLADRSNYVAFKAQADIPNSDVVAPERDLFGQKRVDDPTQLPSGLGGEVFFDLGAVERADFEGGVTRLIVPEDNGVNDLDPNATVVHIDQPAFFNRIILQFTDAGIGIDDASILTDGSQIVVTQTTRTGTVTLVEGTDYLFAYNANTNQAILTSVTTYPSDARFEITVDNSAGSGIKDLAGNPLVQNQSDGSVRFDLLVTNGANDPPVNSVPGTQLVAENTVAAPTSLTFSAANGNAITVDDPDAFISTNQLNVTLTATNGTVTLPAGFGALVTLVTGTGTADTVVEIEGDIDDLNTVLDGLVFTPTQDFNGTASLRILTSDLGNFGSDVPPVAETDDDTILITVTPVNSSPVATSPAAVSVDEDTDFDFTTTLSVSDAVDGDLGDMLVTVMVDQGTLTLSQTTGLTFQNMETGTDEASISFTGSVTDINAALNGLLYHPYGAGASPNGANQHFNGTATLTLTIDDQGNTGAGGALTDTSTTVITVDPVNDDPVITLNGSEFMAVAGPEFDGLERTDFVFDAAGSSLITVDDVDTAEDTGPDSGRLEVTLTATNGILDLPDAALSASGINVSAGMDLSATITFDGLVADVNAVLDGMIFRPDMSFTTPDAMAGPFGTVQIDVNDGGRTGSGGVGTGTALIEINVREVNDEPVITFANTAQAEAVSEDNSLTFSSGTPNNFTIGDSPLDPTPTTELFQLTLTVNSGTLTLSGTSMLSFSFSDTDGTGRGDGTDDATMTFRGTVADINAALDGLVYTPGLHFNGADTLTITVNDLGHSGAGGSRSASDSIALTVNEVNDDPEINAPTLVQAVEDTDLTFSVSAGNGITVSDIEDDPAGTGSGEYQLTMTLVEGDGMLTLATTAGLNQTPFAGEDLDGSDGTLVFRGTKAAINAALDGLVYTPPAGVDGENRLLDMELNDLGNVGLAGPDDGIVTETITIQIDGDNDAPVNLVPGDQSVAEDSDLVFSAGTGNAIEISDLDAGGNVVQVTLRATNGVLTLSDPGLVDFAFAPDANGAPQGDGTADAVMTFRGTIGSASLNTGINGALEGLIFRPTLNFAGPAQIEITTNDLGNSGVAPNNTPLSDVDTFGVTVTPVNDEPAVLSQSPLTVLEDRDVTITAANGNQISVSDVDLGSGKLLVTLTVDHGTLRLFRTTGLVFSNGDGVDDQTMTFSGGLTAVNLALDGMIYRPDPGYVGADTLSIDLNDQGSTGAGGAMVASQDVTITVLPDNDAPVVTVPGLQSTSEDVSLTFAAVNGNAVSVSDVDVNETMGGQVEVTLDVSSGRLAFSTTAGLTGDTDGSDGTLQVQGTLNAVNVALSGLRYTPADDFNGTDTLNVSVSDLGNTGSGNVLTDSDSVTISVSAVNDAPENSLQSTTATISEDPMTPLSFSAGNSNLISVSDVDVQASELVQVTLSVGNGALTLNGTAGLSFSFSDANGTGAGTGTGDASMTFRGTLADINAALDGLDYQPDPDFAGTDTLTVTSNDLGQNGSGGARTDTDSLTITVTGENDAPVAMADQFSVLVGSFVSGNVLANDSDVDGPSLSVVNPLVSDVAEGTLDIDFATGQFTYTPDSMTSATSDSFQYTVTDGLLAGNTVTVTFSINAAPVITGGTFSVGENSGAGTAVGTITASDPNMDNVSLSIIAGNTGSAFAIDDSGNITVNNPTALDFEVTPTFTLTVRATDDAASPGSAEATVTVNLSDEAEAVTIGAADFDTAAGNVTVRRDGSKVRFVNSSTGMDISGAPAHEFANVTSLAFIGRLDAADTLTVDFSAGNPLPAGGISYDGGSGAGSDTLVLEDGGAVVFSSVVHTFASSSSGTVDIDGQVISYAGLEPIADNLDAATRVFSFGAAADTVLISDQTDGDGVSTISSTGTSESVTFDVSGSSVIVNLNDGDDSLVASGLDSGFTGRLTVNAGGGADAVNLSGISASATINGQGGNDILTGGSGNDLIVGNSGDDVLHGGAGDDAIVGGAGRDTVSGGSGNNDVDGNGTSFDVLVEDVSGNVVLTNALLFWSDGSNTLRRIENVELTGGSGDDTIDASGFTRHGVRLEGGDGNDTILGSPFADLIFADSSDVSVTTGGNDFVRAGGGNDIVFGGVGNDLLIGNAGNDQLNGEDGNDRLLGGAGVDTMAGGLGDDDVDGQGATGDVMLVTASGSSVMVTAGDISHGAETDLHNRVERIEVVLDDGDNSFDGGDFTGRLFVFAMGGDDTILGGLGADVIFAGAGDDVVDGRANNDIVYAGTGADAVRGGAGIDRLVGQADDDTLLGSDGNDFLFGGAGRDLLLGEDGDDQVKGQGGRDQLAGGGNGSTSTSGDVVIAGTGDVIDDAFSFDFDALLV